jgi:hypothetical protein
MASFFPQLLLLISLFQFSLATRRLTELFIPQPSSLIQYHDGSLIFGETSINIIWYGNFTPAQRAIVSDFVTSLSSPPPQTPQPSVAAWWQTTDKYYTMAKSNKVVSFHLGTQILDENCSLGKSLTQKQIKQLASKGGQTYAINVVLTAADVLVEGFCMSCGTHGSLKSSALVNGKRHKYAYIWVGNSATQCPGQCAWPFFKPEFGPQTAPLIAPNNDVGMDGLVINLASLLAGTCTNPFGNGFYQGSAKAPLEAASACPGVYGNGAFPGNPGTLLVDSTTGASYNCHGDNGRKYLVPALFDPTTSSCSTLV